MPKSHDIKPMKYCFALYCIVVLPRSTWASTLTNSSSSLVWNQVKLSSSEPIFRFPFSDFLANPCGSTGPNFSHSTSLSNLTDLVPTFPPNDPPPPLRSLNNTNDSLIQQTSAFLVQLRDLYIIDRNFTEEERNDMAHELRLAVMEAKHFLHHIYQTAGLNGCVDHLQMGSLPPVSLMWSSVEGVRVEEVYRGLMIAAAHLHLMIRDAYESSRNCPTENRAYQHNVAHVAGILETIMCLMLHSATGPKDFNRLNFYWMAHSVLQTTVNRYFECSAREIRSCLVLRYAYRVLNRVQLLSTATTTATTMN